MDFEQTLLIYRNFGHEKKFQENLITTGTRRSRDGMRK